MVTSPVLHPFGQQPFRPSISDCNFLLSPGSASQSATTASGRGGEQHALVEGRGRYGKKPNREREGALTHPPFPPHPHPPREGEIGSLLTGGSAVGKRVKVTGEVDRFADTKRGIVNTHGLFGNDRRERAKRRFVRHF